MARKPATPDLPYIAEQLRPLAVPVEQLTPDPANARRHGDRNLSAVMASLRAYGQRKPLVVRRQGMVVEAGNGTLEAAKRLGWTHVAAVVVDDDPLTATGFAIADNRTAELAEWDEATLARLLGELRDADYDMAAHGWAEDDLARLLGPPDEPEGEDLVPIDADADEASGVGGGVHVKIGKKEIPVTEEELELVQKACVATQSGRVIHAAQYALAAKLTGTPLTVYVIPDHRAEEYQRRLSRTYGVFNYDGLPRETYIQTFAQPWRLRGETQRASLLYTEHVIPWLQSNPKARGIDFGSGQGDHARDLRGRGYDLIDVELFRRRGGEAVIDAKAVRSMIDVMADRLERERFDFVVCDFVLNSIDSDQAERSVMAWLNVLAKPGAPVFFSGRRRCRMSKPITVSWEWHGSGYRGFSSLWLKQVQGFDPTYHCIRCLVGPRDHRFHARMLPTVIAEGYHEGDVLYFCGVTYPYRWANNLHLAGRVTEGGYAVVRTHLGHELVVRGLERIDFDDRAARRLYPNAGPKFLTCRNFQLGAQLHAHALTPLHRN